MQDVGPEQIALAKRTAQYVAHLQNAGFSREEAFGLARDFHRELWAGCLGGIGERLRSGENEADAWPRVAAEAASKPPPAGSVTSLSAWSERKPAN